MAFSARCILVIVLLCTSLGALAGDLTSQLLPSLTLPSYRGGDTAPHRLPALGKVTYLDFWASWCGPCRSSFPWLDNLQKKYGTRGFLVVGINKDMERADAERFLEKYPVAFALARDPDDAAAKLLAVTAMPTAVLIDRHGHIRLVHKGFRTADMAALETEILKLIEQP